MTELGPVYRPIGRVALPLLRGYAWVFLGLLAAGVLLGLPLHGHAVVHGAMVLLVPAGAQIILGILVRQLGVWPYRRGYPLAPFVAGSLLAIGLALVGFGMAAVTHGTGVRLLTLPFLLGEEIWIVKTLLDPSSRAAFLERARRRGGRLWSAEAAVGMPIVMLLLLFGIFWSLGAVGPS